MVGARYGQTGRVAALPSPPCALVDMDQPCGLIDPQTLSAALGKKRGRECRWLAVRLVAEEGNDRWIHVDEGLRRGRWPSVVQLKRCAPVSLRTGKAPGRVL